MTSIRWAFKVGAWNPTQAEWTLAATCIQPEEKERIGRFVFKKDAKSAMAGRLLLRKVICEQLGIPYEEIKLSRTDKGKPYLTNPHPHLPGYNFNVSHQGGYAVLAAEPRHQVGVDVMKIEYPKGSRTVEEFFTTMTRQFTESEWRFIRDPTEEWEQLLQFYRFWCLKESYVKAIGTGIGFSLQRLDFLPGSDLTPGGIVSDTRVCVDEILQKDWEFHEVLLDNKHCSAVALHKIDDEESPVDGSSFKELTFQDLVRCARPLNDPDPHYWLQFSKKQTAPGCVS